MSSKSEQPTIQQVPLTQEQTMANQLFKDIQVPWTQEMYDISKSTYQPLVRSLGAQLGESLTQPLQLPEETWANIWQKGQANVAGQYAPLKQEATERAAGRGMLGQGPTEKYMQQLDLSQAKSIESMATDMAIQEWTEKKTAQQQAISNAQSFLTGQPAFSITPQVPQYYSQAGQQSGSPFGSMLGGAGMGALTGLALAPFTAGLSIPMGMAYGAGAGGLAGLGSYYGG